MSSPTYKGQQVAIHFMLGFIPVIKCRKAVPSQFGGDWEWGKWRFIKLSEAVKINAALIAIWKE